MGAWKDKNYYYCGECGSRHPAKHVWLWWPIKFKLAKPKRKTTLISVYGWQVGYAEFGRFVFQRIVRVWRLVIVFGPDHYQGHEYNREHQIWMHPDGVKARNKQLEPYKDFVEKILSQNGE